MKKLVKKLDQRPRGLIEDEGDKPCVDEIIEE